LNLSRRLVRAARRMDFDFLHRGGFEGTAMKRWLPLMPMVRRDAAAGEARIRVEAG